MINKMSILATSMVLLKNNVTISNKNKKDRKVEPVESKYNGDLMKKNPYSNSYIYYKDMKKQNNEQIGKNFDRRI